MVISAVFKALSRATTQPPSAASTETPILLSLSTTAIISQSLQLVTVSSPAVIAAAAINVPASILSGITSYSTGVSSFIPSIVNRGEPMPLILAPILLRQFARSAISGSHAADSITVRPPANVAAISTFAVPSTVEPNGPPRNISLPTNPFGASATMYPPFK